MNEYAIKLTGSILRCALLGLALGICIALFKTEHTMWAFLVALFTISWLTSIKEDYQQELKWISTVLIDKNEYEKVKAESPLYYFLWSNWAKENIKIGMNCDDVMTLLKKDYPKFESSFEMKYKMEYLLCEPSETRKVIVRGYGHNIPTPKLIITASKGKISRITHLGDPF